MLVEFGFPDLGASFRVSAGRRQSQSTANRIQDRPIVSSINPKFDNQFFVDVFLYNVKLFLF